jgi:hypothetical protein
MSYAATKAAPSEPEGGLPSNGPSVDSSQQKTKKPFGRLALSLSCFHVLVYAEADYFKINNLKSMAKEKFRASFMDKPDRISFQAAVAEVYRSIPEYDRGLKDVVIVSTMNNLATLRHGWFPVLTNDLLNCVPEFAIDLCIAALDKYVENPKQSEAPIQFDSSSHGSSANQKSDTVGGPGNNEDGTAARTCLVNGRRMEVRVCLPK